MSNLIENGAVIPMPNNINVSYLLRDNSDYLITEYKMLKAKTDDELLKCSKVLFNGKIKLIYATGGYKTLASIISGLDGNECLRILADMMKIIMDLKENGFLNCQNLVLSEDKIYIDVNKLSAHLIYLPVNNEKKEQDVFENEFRSMVQKIFVSYSKELHPKVKEVCGLLSNGTISFEALYHQVCQLVKDVTIIGDGVFGGNTGSFGGNINSNSKKRVVITALDAPAPISLVVDKEEYVIGKRADAVDGVVAFNKAISRIHCKIIYQQGEFYIMDLGSVNGTYVNYDKVEREQRHIIKHMDTIRLANSSFRVEIGG